VNGAYIAIGAAFIAIGAAMGARSKKAADELQAKNAKTSGILMMLAGVIFMATGVIAGR
jgi:predicted transporter